MKNETKIRVAVVYNHTGEDVYEKYRDIDPSSLDFEPEYDIKVATVTEEYEAIANALSKEGYETELLNIEEDIQVMIDLLTKNPPHVVFNLIEHFKGESELENHVAGLYNLYGVCYTGAGPFTLALCRRKGMTKQLLLANKVPTPRYRLLSEPKLPARHGLHYPMIVKPAREDASSGVEKDSVVYNLDQLNERINKVFQEYQQPILVEEFIEGRELHVSILGNDPPEVLPIIEFDFSELPSDHPTIISYDAKWEPLEESFQGSFRMSCKTDKAVREESERCRACSLQNYRLS